MAGNGAESGAAGNGAAGSSAALYKPLGLLAELTHRCPLGCPYCSNPLALDRRGDELDTETWARVFAEAAALGVLVASRAKGEKPVSREPQASAEAARSPAARG